MRLKNLKDLEQDDHMASADMPMGLDGNPLLVPSEIWRNIKVNFERLKVGRRKQSSRVGCRGRIALLDRDGRVVAKGRLRDINEKSSGLEFREVSVNIDDVFYLEFLNQEEFVLTQVKVVLRRVQPTGTKIRVGCEFVDATSAFQEKLGEFLVEKRREQNGFEELEDI